VFAAAVAAGTGFAVPQNDAGAALSNGKSSKPVCANAPARAADCHAEVVTKADGVTPDAGTQPPTGAYGPADIQAAYALPGGAAGAGATVAVVDAYDNPNAESDLAAYRNANGLPVCR